MLPQRDEPTLREYVEALFDARLDILKVRIQAIEKSIDTAYNVAEERRRGQNEWRDTVTDLIATRVTKDEHQRIEAAVQELLLSRAELAGKASQSSVNFAYIISVVGILLGVVGIAVALWS